MKACDLHIVCSTITQKIYIILCRMKKLTSATLDAFCKAEVIVKLYAQKVVIV
jgi:hypothetical protein